MSREPQCEGGRQVAARALARDRHLRRRHAERRGVGDRPARDRLAVVEAGGERVLGREAVAHRDHHRAGRLAQLAGDVVHDADAADHHAAAVEVDDESRRRLLVVVDADGDALDRGVVDARDLHVARSEKSPRASSRISGSRVSKTVFRSGLASKNSFTHGSSTPSSSVARHGRPPSPRAAKVPGRPIDDRLGFVTSCCHQYRGGQPRGGGDGHRLHRRTVRRSRVRVRRAAVRSRRCASR